MASVSNQSKQKTSITWYGHAAFAIRGGTGACVLIDPWLSDNPGCPAAHRDLSMHRPTAILLSHGHGDHGVCDAAKLLVQNKGAKVFAIVEVATWLMKQQPGGIAESQVVGINRGGTVDLGNGFRATLVSAAHSSSMPDGSYGGEACGWIVHTPDGHRIYHSGDTDVFEGMRVIGDLWKPDVALLCIGDLYTMGPYGAAYALQKMLPSVVVAIPMHFGQLPGLTGTSSEFISLVAKARPDVFVHVLAPGSTTTELSQ